MSEAVAELKALIAERVAAVAARDPGPLEARTHPEVRTFDVLPPLQTRGAGAMGQHLAAWFDAYRDGPRYEVRDLEVDAEGDLGYAAFLYRVSGTLTSQAEVDMWVRATLVLRRGPDGWRIVHDHESVPFDPATGRAVLGGHET